MCTRIVNDKNKEVALGIFGDGVNQYYCGLFFGRGEIPGSDGYCGPHNGPPCASCVRFVKNGVPAHIAEIARLRADKLDYVRILGRRHEESMKDFTELRKELDLEKKKVRELQADKKACEKRIRELDDTKARDEYSLGDQWTSKEVWPHVFRGLAKAFHPDKTSGHEDKEKLEACFKIVNAKNEVLTGKGVKSAADTEREEQSALAREKREADEREAAERESKRPKCVMDAEVLDLLVKWDLMHEESWLLEMGVFIVRDFTYLRDDELKARDARLTYLVDAMKARET
jgi:hypothetical protein